MRPRGRVGVPRHFHPQEWRRRQCLQEPAEHGLIEEATATDQNTVWRHDEELGPITLRATARAYRALGIGGHPQDQPESARASEPTCRRSGTSEEALIAMLLTEGGVTIDEIVFALH